MIREIDENLIRPKALLSSSDMARIGCSGCEGCGECCRDRAESITLDAYDTALLKMNLNCSFEKLLEKGFITLAVTDGVVLPTLSKKADKDECIFLGQDGRCAVHSFRPGICRMFPLARIYHEDGSFHYFIQEGECEHLNGVKVKISKWLEYPDIKGYETAVRSYHDSLKDLREACSHASSTEEIVELQRQFLDDWFIRP